MSGGSPWRPFGVRCMWPWVGPIARCVVPCLLIAAIGTLLSALPHCVATQAYTAVWWNEDVKFSKPFPGVREVRVK